MKRLAAVLVSAVVVGTGVMGVPAPRAAAETPNGPMLYEPYPVFPAVDSACTVSPTRFNPATSLVPQCIPASYLAAGFPSWGANVASAWGESTETGVSGDGVVVAVLDTGSLPHPDIATSYLPGYDFVSNAGMANDLNGRDNDPTDSGSPTANTGAVLWHGLHVAGTVAARDNSEGVVGVAPNAKVLPVRVITSSGGSSADVIAGIRWAANLGPDPVYGWFGATPSPEVNPNPARVINLSLGGSDDSCDSATQRAVSDAIAAGVVVVAAAGNSNADASGFTPANCAGVITVSATDWTGNKAVWSSGGVVGGPNWGSTVDISAPGVDILSLYDTGTASNASPAYAVMSGTSMAAPHVAGAVALMLDANPSLSPAQVESILVDTAYAFASTPSQPIGSGILNAGAAIEAVRGLPVTPVAPPAPAPVPVVVAPSSVASAWRTGKARSVTVRWTPPASTGNSPITGYIVTSNANKSWRTSADARELTFDSLVRGKEYRFAVAADNGSFTGPATWTSWIRIPIVRRSSTLLSVIIPAPKGSTKRVYSASGRCRKSGKYVKASSSKGTCKVTLRYRLNGKTQTLRASVPVQ